MEYLEFNDWNQRDLARRACVTPKTISEICNGKAPITPATSLAFEKVFRRPAHFWLNLQRQYDEWIAREAFRNHAKSWAEWSKKFPIRELRALKLLPDKADVSSDLEALLAFLGVSSPAGWEAVWQALHVSFRQTKKIETSIECISSWVRATEYFAESLRVSEFDRTAVERSIGELRACTTRRASQAIDDAQSICASMGIAFVVIPGFKKTGISGCARWLSSNKAMIALSNRYKTDDRLWFTFFHELAHLLLHRKTHVFILDNAVENLSDRVIDPMIQKQEEEANRFAADKLIPPELLSEFIGSGTFTNSSIKNFAEQIDIGPGIVVGRLQHEEILKPFQGNRLKQYIELQIQ